MSRKMDPGIKAKWLAALRSGEFTQGRNYLAMGATYCCLGVLCELAARAGVVDKRLHSGYEDEQHAPRLYGSNLSELPSPVMLWADLDGDPLVIVDALPVKSLGVAIPNELLSEEKVTLAALNDAGVLFREIADIIEREL